MDVPPSWLTCGGGALIHLEPEAIEAFGVVPTTGDCVDPINSSPQSQSPPQQTSRPGGAVVERQL